MNVPNTRTVVAVVGSSDCAAVVAAATERAALDAATLVVYAVDAAGAFSSVRPTWWSAEGQRAAYGGALTPLQLEMLGEHDLALAVQRARLAGVESYGWLPTQRGAAGVTRYARDHRPDVLICGREHAALTEKVAGREVV
ncbi:MAG TPA: hypothetical protein VNQ77_14335 [Frankiaceae bacterium]|nr:hypothetical protein [Frankiaceae bacterium]